MYEDNNLLSIHAYSYVFDIEQALAVAVLDF